MYDVQLITGTFHVLLLVGGPFMAISFIQARLVDAWPLSLCLRTK
jgi:hypothetical protein